MSYPEQILAAVSTVLASVPSLQARVFEHNPAAPPPMAQTPVAVVRFDSVDPQVGLRERSFSFAIDVFGEASWYQPLGIGPQRALLRLAKDVEVALMNARSGVLDKLRFDGANRIVEEDGQTRNGVTLNWSVIYSEQGVV